MVEFLLAKGMNPSAENKDGETPLHVVLEHLSLRLTYYENRAYRDIAKLLLTYGADPCVKNDDGISPLHMAAEEGFRSIVELMLTNGADPCVENEDGETPLDIALKRNHTWTTRVIRAKIKSYRTKIEKDQLQLF
jgi:cytohesin